jgi:hypothetical protein
MRTMAAVALAMLVGPTVMAMAAATAHAYPTAHLAVRIAEQHNKVDKDDGAPDAWGPKLELSAGVQATELVSVWGVAAESWYSDSQLMCGVLRTTYDIHVEDEWLGLRLLLHPHPTVFIGFGYTQIYTKEETDRGSDSFDNGSWEFTVGGNPLTTQYGTLQVMLNYGYYDRFNNLEHVQFLTLGGGWQF